MGEIKPSPETCGVIGDEDCDGQTNEEGPDCQCSPGSSQPCYSADPSTEGVGVCQAGSQVCNPDGLGFGACNGEITPIAETCTTSEDDDCDGDLNEEGAGCVCYPLSNVACYSGPAGTENVGACAPGAAQCNADGTALGPCLGEVLPAVETCNTLVDDDCDGQVNEDGVGCVCEPGATELCYSGPSGTQGVGICTAGTRTCAWHGLSYGACAGQVTPSFETCSPADEDCNGVTYACTGAHVWSQRFGSAPYQEVYEVAVDSAGDVLIVGYFEGSIDLGGGVLTSAGGSDMFVAKLDGSGAHLWSKRFGGPIDDRGFGVAVDASDNVLLTGKSGSNVDFGGGPLAGLGAHVIKLDTNGEHVWSKKYGSSNSMWGTRVAVDPSNNVLVTGYLDGSADFGGGTLISAGAEDVFLLKLSSAGAHVWSKRFGDASGDYGVGVATDSAGNVFITGEYQGTIGFGGTPLVSAGATDIYLAKFAPNGFHSWSKRFGSSAPSQAGYGLVTDTNDNVLVTGRFIGAVDFGGGPLTSAGNLDGFLAKFDGAGVHVWSKRFGGTSDDWGHGLVVDGAGDIVLSGYFASTIDLGGGVLTSAGSHDVFIAKLNAAGDHWWSQRFGSTGAQYSYSLAVDADDSLFVGGSFHNVLDLGGGPLTSAGWLDGFVAKLQP